MIYKVSMYQSQYVGAPMTEITNSIFLNVEEGTDVYEEITKAVVSILRDNIGLLPAPELVDMISQHGIINQLDLAAINIYLTKYASLRIFVNVVESTTTPDLNPGDYTIMALVPVDGEFKRRTDFIVNDSDFSIRGIVGELVAKFGMGSSIVPINDLGNLVSTMTEMEEKGMPMTEMFQNTLVNQLAEYGCELYFIYQ